jgi:hypothetical protein
MWHIVVYGEYFQKSKNLDIYIKFLQLSRLVLRPILPVSRCSHANEPGTGEEEVED